MVNPLTSTHIDLLRLEIGLAGQFASLALVSAAAEAGEAASVFVAVFCLLLVAGWVTQIPPEVPNPDTAIKNPITVVGIVARLPIP